ncbi:MAG: stage sporulation protein [Mahella sp.]|nr:stage sporulation protein [Mahella sp.]
MKRWHIKQIIGILLSLLVFAIYYSPVVQDIIKFPSELEMSEGQYQIIPFRLPMEVKIQADDKNVLKINGQSLEEAVIERKIDSPLIIQPQQQGKAALQFKLFGIIPVKDMSVNVVSPVKVLPGGQAIGVTLYTDGALVVGVSEFRGEDGLMHHPANDSGLMPGDIIEKANDTIIKDADHLAEIVNSIDGRPVKLDILRNDKPISLSIKPVKDMEEHKYKLGIWVRDSTAGVGTMTFYEPNNRIYGALGHPITDMDTGTLLSIKNGEIVHSEVIAVKEGKKGKPGELQGVFLDDEERIGNIEVNTEYGIFGHIYADSIVTNRLYKEPIPVALQSEVQEGSATILATVDDQGVKAYDVKIIRVNRQSQPNGKSLVVEITDPTLLKLTGGIVQGMSGSPIIQNGKLVGAVTHVFINDPKRGYGVFAKWMLEEIGIETDDEAVSPYKEAVGM